MQFFNGKIIGVLHFFIYYFQLLPICMIPGAKGPAFHACMKKHDLGTRTNMRKQPD